ncbi:MAG: hypothetical protein GC200_12175 [Tepidisphaera sp.]|nr:hypothetical protein [Tepidisphaera sp.]
MSVDAGYLEEGLTVADLNRRLSQAIDAQQRAEQEALDASIRSSEQLLAELNVDVSSLEAEPATNVSSRIFRAIPAGKTWAQLLGESGQRTESIRFEDLLTPDEIKQVNAAHDAIGAELKWSGVLNKRNVTTAVFAGGIAGAIDIFLVGVPKSQGFLGSGPNEGGWLSNFVKGKFGEAFPEDKISALEKAYKTAYDPSVNSKLSIPIEGLGPRTHRYQSFGHDPLLGFVFGIKDILTGNLTAVSKYGNVITQKVDAPFMPDENFVVRVLEALKLHWGHLRSDVATPAGLPAPLMPLLSFLQFGKIGDKNYTISEVARIMYRSGYDFRHFVASSFPAVIAELIVRFGHVFQCLHEGNSPQDSIPLASNPAVRRGLIIAHGVATAMNAGKVYFTGNLMGISWVEILALTRYLAPELRYLMFGQDAEKARMVEEVIWNGYVDIDAQTTNLKASVEGSPLII